MLLNSGVILPNVVIEITIFFQNMIKQYINEENRTNEIEELGELVRNHNSFISMQSITSSLKPYGLRTDFLNYPIEFVRCL